jgi:predicted metal-dependent enzyme (double-stranded beta helix superfamily)
MATSTPSRSVRWFICGVSAYVFSAVAYGQAGPPSSKFLALQPEDMRPADGTTQKVISGDPSKPGMYVVQNTFAPGRIGRPHYHDQDRYITVIKGTCRVSLGPESDVYDPKQDGGNESGELCLPPRLRPPL